MKKYKHINVNNNICIISHLNELRILKRNDLIFLRCAIFKTRTLSLSLSCYLKFPFIKVFVIKYYV